MAASVAANQVSFVDNHRTPKDRFTCRPKFVLMPLCLWLMATPRTLFRYWGRTKWNFRAGEP
jgi:hypothetical protein